jgi:hypothetical protein
MGQKKYLRPCKMNFKLIALIFWLFPFLGSNDRLDTKGTTENLIGILGTKVDSRDFKEYKKLWSLDKNLENRDKGIKLYPNTQNGEIQSIALEGGHHPLSSIPFGITWDDKASVIAKKLGAEGNKPIGRSTLKYYRGNLAVEVTFIDASNEKIKGIKFYKETPKFIPPVIKRESTVAMKAREGLKEFEPSATNTSTTCSSESLNATCSSFKQAILDVFRSYNESSFVSIKGDMRAKHNFWNYQFTYATKLKIPGEQFNMLYSFPFLNSPLDFVSVIQESDNLDQTIEKAHKTFEKKLLENFPEKEGWVATCIPNKESKKLPDVEFRNDKYGAIILDYSKNPKGKHVVYLRFLLFSS